jgi:hypothetical protein
MRYAPEMYAHAFLEALKAQPEKEGELMKRTF